MRAFDETDRKIGKLEYMTRGNAEFMRDFISDRNLSSLLEIGFFKGKSTAYFAAILEDLGRGHVTTIDKKSALDHEPNIDDVMETTGLSHRVTRILAEPDLRQRLSAVGIEPRPSTPEAFDRLVREEVALLTKIARAANIKAD